MRDMHEEEPAEYDAREGEPPYEGENVLQQLDVFDPEPVLVTEPDLGMADHEAWHILEKITAAQAAIATTEQNAKDIVAEKRTDLKRWLGDWDRLPRLLQWRAAGLKFLPKGRKTISTLAGKIGAETVPAKLTVGDKGLALEWCRLHCPEAIVPTIDADKLPAPAKAPNEHGEPVWTPPEGSGLLAVPEHEETTINGRFLRVLLEGPKRSAREGRGGEAPE